MSRHEDRDSIPIKARAESQRVEPGGETLDPVVTEAAIDQNQGITRKPDDSVAEPPREEEFSQTRLDQLLARWDNGAEAFWISYGERCEIIYEIQLETARPGCKGGFSTALRRIHLSDSTAYDMIKRHRIRLGEIPDPDSPDSRDEADENLPTIGGTGPKEGDNSPEQQSAEKLAPRLSLVSKDKSGPSRRKKAKPQSKPVRLDARQQASMVKAQLAINNVVAALKNNGNWQSALAEYDKVAVAPGKLDSFLNTLNPEPDWKAILIELVAVLEHHGEKLPVPVLNKKRTVEKLLGGKDLQMSDRTDRVVPDKRSEAGEATANLNSPVVSVSDRGDDSKKLPVCVTLNCAVDGSAQGGAI
jgi:hypothetical protein